MVEPVMFLDTFKPKRDNVKEWVTHVVYSVNQKFKDCNPIDASAYTYPCTGGPQIVRILGHQGIVLLQKLY